MQSLTSFARIEIEVFLVALLLIVGFQVITGKINLKGLLLEKTGSEKTDSAPAGFSPARLQMLLVTFAGAFYIISQVVDLIHQGKPGFPTLDNRLFLLLGGSHSVYLGGKLNSFSSLFEKLFGKSDTKANSLKGDQQ